MLFLSTQLPETKAYLDFEALKLKQLINGYKSQFKNVQLMSGGLLMGMQPVLSMYLQPLHPFIAINLLHMNLTVYGIANILPPIGLALGSLFSAQLIKQFATISIIRLGAIITLIGSILLLIFLLIKLSTIVALFIPMIVCYFGLALIFTNASTISMSSATDKAQASAVMNLLTWD